VLALGWRVPLPGEEPNQGSEGTVTKFII
jgi:hypothetical protein